MNILPGCILNNSKQILANKIQQNIIMHYEKLELVSGI